MSIRKVVFQYLLHREPLVPAPLGVPIVLPAHAVRVLVAYGRPAGVPLHVYGADARGQVQRRAAN